MKVGDTVKVFLLNDEWEATIVKILKEKRYNYFFGFDCPNLIICTIDEYVTDDELCFEDYEVFTID